MNFLKIKETCLYVNDLEKAKEFYHEILCLPIINYAEGKHLFLKAGTSVLLLFNPVDSRQKKSPPAHYGGGRQHFAFEVSDNNYRALRPDAFEKFDWCIKKSAHRRFFGNIQNIVIQDVVRRNNLLLILRPPWLQYHI